MVSVPGFVLVVATESKILGLALVQIEGRSGNTKDTFPSPDLQESRWMFALPLHVLLVRVVPKGNFSLRGRMFVKLWNMAPHRALVSSFSFFFHDSLLLRCFFPAPRWKQRWKQRRGDYELLPFTFLTCPAANGRVSGTAPTFHLLLALHFKIQTSFLSTTRLTIKWNFTISSLDFLPIWSPLSSDNTATLKKRKKQQGPECSQKKGRAEALAARELPVSGFFFLFNGSHTPLSESVSDFQGTTLILHQTFSSSCCCLARLWLLKLIFH